MKPILLRQPVARTPRRQRGVVLLFALIALAVMMIASVALVRSFNSSLYTSGNIAFKRDMQNQAQRAVTDVLTLVQTGDLATPEARSTKLASHNYSAVSLGTTAEGIPTALLAPLEEFEKAWTAAAIKSTDKSIVIHYLVDRLCDVEGLDSDLGAARCQIVGRGEKGGSGSHLVLTEGSSSDGKGGSSALPIVYRISIRVDGPRGSQSFYQTTFTM